MNKLEPLPGELEHPECAAFFVTLESIYRAQAEQGKLMAKHFAELDYLAIKAWAERYSKLREQEKEARYAIFGYRRRWKTERRRNAAGAWSGAIEALSFANGHAAGAGAPMPQPNGETEPAPPLSLVVPGSSPPSPEPQGPEPSASNVTPIRSASARRSRVKT